MVTNQILLSEWSFNSHSICKQYDWNHTSAHPTNRVSNKKDQKNLGQYGEVVMCSRCCKEKWSVKNQLSTFKKRKKEQKENINHLIRLIFPTQINDKSKSFSF